MFLDNRVQGRLSSVKAAKRQPRSPFRLKLAFCFWRTCRLVSLVRVIAPKSGMHDLGLLVNNETNHAGARLILFFCQLQGLVLGPPHKEPCRPALVAEALLVILFVSDIETYYHH